MGVIYSPHELLHELVPEPTEHTATAFDIMDKLSALEQVRTVYVHGSVAEGRHNRRSDLDVVVIYDDSDPENSPDHIRAINRALTPSNTNKAVKVECKSIWPAGDTAEMRQLRIGDGLFAKYLAGAIANAEYYKGEEDTATLLVAEGIDTSDPEAMRDLALRYTVHKQSRFTTAPPRYDHTDEKVMAALQRAYELPKSIHRKLDPFLASHTDIVGEIDLYDPTLLGTSTLRAFKALQQMDASYSEMLELTLLRRAAGGQYERGFEHNRYADFLKQAYAPAINAALTASSGVVEFISSYGKKTNIQ